MPKVCTGIISIQIYVNHYKNLAGLATFLEGGFKL